METSFYSHQELKDLGLQSFGIDVKISRKASLYGVKQISIGNHVRIDDFSILSGQIVIGNYVHIAPFCGLFGSEGIQMEDFAGLSSRVTVYSVTDDYSGICLTNPTIPDVLRRVVGGPVHFGRHVIVGAGSVILPNVSIGVGAAIGAMSLVRKDIEPWSIQMGIPARQIGTRKKELLVLEDQLPKSLDRAAIERHS